MSVLSVRGLCYGRSERTQILNSVSLDVAAGEVLAILGPNGAGKSTLLSCMLGLRDGWHGSISLGGRDIRMLSRREMARLTAYVPQATDFAFAFEVAHIVLMGRFAHFGRTATPSLADRKRVDGALESTGILHLRSRLFTELSGGERQLVLLARALAQDSPAILLDEPTASLDLGNQGRVLSLIRDLARSGKAVVMTTHLPDQAFLLDCQVALMKTGRIVARGPVAEVCDQPAMSSLYGTSLRRLTDESTLGIMSFVADLR